MPAEDAQESQIRSLIETIDENADPLHLDFTPSVLALIEFGLPGARAVLDLLNSRELLTRRRAQRVLEGVVMRRNGWVPGQGYQDADAQERTQALLRANGDYDAAAGARERKKSITKWRRWLQEQEQADQQRGEEP